jgi:phosphoribosylaminoimidazolecarboxamide formyltransferase/IMP cyclohydrolase
MSGKELPLRYGCNPHQVPARIFMESGELPIQVMNGSPGYINLLDAFNSWQLVRELRQALDMPAAASFKHVSPAGAAVGVPLSESLKKAYFVEDMELSPLGAAYARARGADRMSSFGDWAALSDMVDVATAKLLAREVSDGVIAPGYEDEALAILKAKRGGKYSIIQIEQDWEPEDTENRQVFGITFEQKRNSRMPGFELLDNVVTKKKDLPESARRDLVVAMVGLKYTQSNSVCYALDGQLIGVGAGQQSRIHCTRLAGEKADRWLLRQHPAVLGFKYRKDLKRVERDNALDQYFEGGLTPEEEARWKSNFREAPERLSREQKREWLDAFSEVALASDAFFPFRDNIDRANQSGVRYIVQPGGAVRDDVVIEACNEYGMVMAFSGLRLFHH